MSAVLSPLVVVSLDNLEQLQEQWANAVSSCDDETSVPPQPILNSPRSLDACRRSGIDPKVDLSKTTLRAVLLETIRRIGPDGSVEVPVVPPDVSAGVTAERARVLQLYPFSLRNVGTDDDKLRAYDKYQQREGRRVSTIRMLREIRSQLIAAEEFKMRKAHETAVTKSKAGGTSPPVPLSKRSLSTDTADGKKDSTTTLSRENSAGRASDGGESDVSLSTASTAQHHRQTLTQKNVLSMQSRSSGQRYALTSEAGPNTQRVTRATRRSAGGEINASCASEGKGYVSTENLNEDDTDDGDLPLFVHRSRAYDDDGVEFTHIVANGPDPEFEDERTDAALNAVEAAKRQQKRKEAERLAAIAREQKQRLIEEEERKYIRERILQGRNTHRKIQTPAPLQWSAFIPASAQEPMANGKITIHGAFDEGQQREGGGPANDAAAARPPASIPLSPRGELASVPTSQPRSPRSTPGTSHIQPPQDLEESASSLPRGSAVGGKGSPRRSPRDAPLFDLMTPSAAAGVDEAPRKSAEASVHGGGATAGADGNDQAHRRRREAIEAAEKFRQTSSFAASSAALGANLSSPLRDQFHREDPGFDFSNPAARARAVESRMTEAEANLEMRWKALERAKKAQEMLLSGRSTSSDRAVHGETVFL